MKLVIYNLLTLMLVPVFLTRILFKSLSDKDYRKNIGNRFGNGLSPATRKKDKIIWFHAVSLGEVIGSQDVIKKLLQEFDVVITTSTPTGLRKAKELFKDQAAINYAPWDFTSFIHKYVTFYQPDAVLIFETEIWPSMISIASKQKIPFYLINGRLSKKSFQAYALTSWFIKDILQQITFSFVQTSKHEERFIKLGVSQQNIKVVGSVKFDAPGLIMNPVESSSFILGASTHPEEEKILLNVYSKFKNRADFKLYLCPRHPERSAQIFKLADDMGFSTQLFSELKSQSFEVCIIDRIGLLPGFYASAAMAFVGGSLVPRGGHNLIESAVLGAPIIIGPYTFNFEDIVNEFLQDKACIKVIDENDLLAAITLLANNPEIAKQYSLKAKGVVERNKGSTETQASYIINELGEKY